MPLPSKIEFSDIQLTQDEFDRLEELRKNTNIEVFDQMMKDLWKHKPSYLTNLQNRAEIQSVLQSKPEKERKHLAKLVKMIRWIKDIKNR